MVSIEIYYKVFYSVGSKHRDILHTIFTVLIIIRDGGLPQFTASSKQIYAYYIFDSASSNQYRPTTQYLTVLVVRRCRPTTYYFIVLAVSKYKPTMYYFTALVVRSQAYQILFTLLEADE